MLYKPIEREIDRNRTTVCKDNIIIVTGHLSVWYVYLLSYIVHDYFGTSIIHVAMIVKTHWNCFQSNDIVGGAISPVVYLYIKEIQERCSRK